MNEESTGKRDHEANENREGAMTSEAREEVLNLLRQELSSLPDELESVITQSLRENKTAITLNHEGEKFLEKTTSEIWVPPLITAIATLLAVLIGFGTWYGFQADALEKMSIDQQKRRTELALKEEYIKRRFDAYEELNGLTSLLLKSVKEESSTSQSLQDITIFLLRKGIYLSDDVQKKAEEVRLDVIDFTTEPDKNDRVIEKKIRGIRTQIKSEMESFKIQ